ncbi:hypothetical protein EON80_20405 [bacterium]|nr:MAG: hypothetical protein EON80_20405 [bacterium]
MALRNEMNLIIILFPAAMIFSFGRLLFFHLQLMVYSFQARTTMMQPANKATLQHDPWDYTQWDQMAFFRDPFAKAEEIRALIAGRDDVFSAQFRDRFEWIYINWLAAIRFYVLTLGVLAVLGFSFALFDSWDAPFQSSEDGGSMEIYGANTPSRMEDPLGEVMH